MNQEPPARSMSRTTAFVELRLYATRRCSAVITSRPSASVSFAVHRDQQPSHDARGDTTIIARLLNPPLRATEASHIHIGVTGQRHCYWRASFIPHRVYEIRHGARYAMLIIARRLPRHTLPLAALEGDASIISAPSAPFRRVKVLLFCQGCFVCVR